MDSAGTLPALHPAPPRALWEASVGKSFCNNCCLPIYIGEACQAKWKYLRDMYRRQRKEQKGEENGSEGGTKRSWKYMGILSFWEPHVQDRETTSNYSGPQETTETAEHILNAIYESGGEGTAGESEVMICTRISYSSSSRKIRLQWWRRQEIRDFSAGRRSIDESLLSWHCSCLCCCGAQCRHRSCGRPSVAPHGDNSDRRICVLLHHSGAQLSLLLWHEHCCT